jgi:uncharacterized protein
MLYLDSSAIVKLVAREAETPALVDAVRSDPAIVSSALAWTEVTRAVARAGGTRARATAVLERIALIPIDEGILEEAATIAPVELRTLDAIHLATALTVRDDLAALVAYDVRLIQAAEAAGLPAASPGVG